MCPEMLSKSGHGFEIDCYSLGALLFEMLTGLPPHYSRNRQQMYNRILNEEITIPSYVSLLGASLIKGLLCKNPKNRLGTKGLHEIKKHPYLAEFNWDDLYKRKIPPPNKLDPRQSQFDPEYTSMKITWSEGDDDLGTRSLSLLENCLEINKKRMIFEEELTESSPKYDCAPQKRISMAPKSEKKIGKSRAQQQIAERQVLVDVTSTNWKTFFALFAGYPYSKDSVPVMKKSPIKTLGKGLQKSLTSTVASLERNNSTKTASDKLTDSHKLGASVKSPKNNKQEEVKEKHRNINRMESENIKKTVLTKAAYLKGESNESDISITETDNEPTEEDGNYPTLGYRPPNTKLIQRSNSACRGAQTTNAVEISNLPRPGQSPKKEECKSGIITSKFSKELAQELAKYDTCALLKEELSKTRANIIKLNDDASGIVSERKRGIVKKTPPGLPRPEKARFVQAKPTNARPKLNTMFSSTNVTNRKNSNDSHKGSNGNTSKNKEHPEKIAWAEENMYNSIHQKPNIAQSSIGCRRTSTNFSKCDSVKESKPEIMHDKPKALVSQKMTCYQSSFIGNASKDLDFTKANNIHNTSVNVITQAASIIVFFFEVFIGI